MAKSKQPAKPKSKSAKPDLNLGSPKWNLATDRKSVTAKFLNDSSALLNVDTAGVEELQQALGQIRGNMIPEVSATLAQGEKISIVPNPVWVAVPAGTTGDSVLHFRDPRYGWVHYLIPKTEGAKLLTFLQKQIGTPSS
jgi:hypothetical protein